MIARLPSPRSPLVRALIAVIMTGFFVRATPLLAQAAHPVIRYANLLGGTDDDTPAAVTAGPDGSIYVTGYTKSADFPVSKRLSTSHDATFGDAFVAKIDQSGGRLVYSVIVGGGQPAAIAVDAAGNVYVAGTGSSTDFPLTTGSLSFSGRGFLFKLDPTGSNLVYSTRFGGSSLINIPFSGLTLDGAGNAYLVGYGADIRTTSGAYKATGFGAFAMKVNPTGSDLLYGTYLPASPDHATAQPKAIAIDSAGNVYITGAANQSGFPTTIAKLPAEIPSADSATTTDDVFLVKLSADGTSVPIATLFGGYGDDVGNAILLDPDGSIYIGGRSQVSTGSGSTTPFPTTEGALDRGDGFPRGFLVKLSSAADAFRFSTFLPGSQSVDCIGLPDSGVDVLTQSSSSIPRSYLPPILKSLLRLNRDGTTLLSSANVGVAIGSACAISSGFAVLSGATMNGPAVAVTSPALQPIGAPGKADVWFSAISVDSPGLGRLDVDTGELLFNPFNAPDGSYPEASRAVHATTGDRNVPIGVFKFGLNFVSASPLSATTPAAIEVTAPQGRYTDGLLLFAPGVEDGLRFLGVTMDAIPVLFEVEPLARALPSAYGGGTVEFTAVSRNSPPVSATILATTGASGGPFLSFLSAPLDFTVAATQSLPKWLTVDPLSGTTPAQLRLTVNPAGLPPNAMQDEATIQLLGPMVPGLFPQSTFTLDVRFQIGPSPTAQTVVLSDPNPVRFRVTGDHPKDSQVVHLAADTGAPVGFEFASLPDWLSVNPQSGTTPADVTMTASPALSNTQMDSYVSILGATDGSAVGSVEVVADAVSPDYVGFLMPGPLSSQPDTVNVQTFAPGALFYIGIADPLLVPAAPAEADPAQLAPLLAGYSFTFGGHAVPLRSYASGRFLAQAPVELNPGLATLNALDASGRVVATAQVYVAIASPQYEQTGEYALRARKQDGSVIDPQNPALPGDQIRVSLTGQGAVTPALPSGSASPASNPSVPVLSVTATIGGLPVTIVSALMSDTEAGILDVWLEVPKLADANYNVSIDIGDYGAGKLPIAIGNLTPQIPAGGVVNAASYGPQIAPGSLISIFGSGLAQTTQSASTLPLPMTLGGAAVTIGGIPAPLVYVSPSQINAQAPYELSAAKDAPVAVTVNGVPAAAASVSVGNVSVGIFQFGQNRAVVQNQDSSLNDATHGAAPGEYIVLYLTGAGATDNPVPTGAAAPAMPLSRVIGPIEASIDGVPADVLFGGLAPGFVGLTQVNIRVPALPPGSYPTIVSVAGESSNSALVTIK